MTMSHETTRATAIYCRISRDRAGEGLGVERQEVLCRELAATKGWPVGEVYVDNDLSAYSGKPRPEYERMLGDLANGRRDAVLVVDQDRLTRHPRELEDFIAFADRHGVALANVSGDVDLSTSDGRFKARIMGAVARQESEKKSERLRRQRDQAARQGRPNGGRRAFGYERDGMTVRPAEAERVREAAGLVWNGASLRSIAPMREPGISRSRRVPSSSIVVSQAGLLRAGGGSLSSGSGHDAEDLIEVVEEPQDPRQARTWRLQR